MSKILGQVHHLGYVCPDLDQAIAQFAAAGIGPFFRMTELQGVSLFRGELLPISVHLAFCYSGKTCFELVSAPPGCPGSYTDFLARMPQGGLHHVAYSTPDFAAALADMAAAGHPLEIVQEFRIMAEEPPFEIYCEPAGAANGLVIQLLKPGPFDAWFDYMREQAANWDGSDLIRNGDRLLGEVLAGAAA